MTNPYGRPSKNGKTKATGEQRRRYYVKWKYGVDWDTYLLWQQQGCAICKTTTPISHSIPF